MSAVPTSEARTRPRGPIPILRNVLLACASMAAALLLAEACLRLRLPAPPYWRVPQESYVFDEQIDHTLEPNQRSFTHDKVVETNSLGIRDRDYAAFPEPGVTRVLAMGDSQTFGNGLDLAHTWPKQLERLLNDPGGGTRWEVLNCGVPGTDTWQHEILLDRMLRAYHPAAAVVAVYPNDVTKPFRPDPARTLSTGTLDKRLGYLLKESAVFLVGLDGFRGLKQKLSPTGEILREHAILTGEREPDVDEGWKQVERSLVAMKENCERAGAELLVLVIPRRDEVAGIERSRAFNERVHSIADRNRIAWVDPLGALEREYKRSGQAMFIAWDGHNSGIANEVIGRELAPALRAPHSR